MRIIAAPCAALAESFSSEFNPMAYVYMLECADGSLYTGFALDVEARVACHNAGLGAKYTRSRRPVRLLWQQQLPTPRLARRAEAYIKRLTRQQKQRLAAGQISLMQACPQLSAEMTQDNNQ